MEKKIRVSVCIVTYNQEKYIEQCLQSIVDQEGNFELEIIVGDDCSTDSTSSIVAEFQQKYPSIIRKLDYKSNIGPTENFLKVHESATGEFVCHCDGDDYWYPNKIQTQLKIMLADENVVQIWHCTHIVDDNSKVINMFPSKLARLCNPTVLTAANIANSYALVGHHSSQMYRRSARDVDVRTEIVLDYWVAFSISLKGKSVYLKDCLSAYRVTSSDSVTRNKSSRRVTVDALACHLEDIIRYYPTYKQYAASNAWSRFFLSKIAGHDVSLIKDCALKNQRFLRPHLLFTSLWYSILQKVKL
ncbi:hypothetical protein CWC14_04965 [Pseudoalteromonas sp. S3260]|uniref:glycosyltransferase n=1 Tax=Pseudoalteromonas sp. S3260 TaxID=579534 RepID=UPI00110B89D8|nr:glycosyltransferase [Pseudoalteromonas sp. S3260]TMO99296.1 hypothetical protein CWC14_04965 [Pseudoalteromonas sp. S3260]